VGPQHLFNIKRLAYAVRTAAEAFETGGTGGTGLPASAGIAAEIVDRFLARRAGAPDPERQTPETAGASDATPQCACNAPAPAPAAAPPAPKPEIVDFVCEEDVRNAIKHSRKIYIGPKTIVTPSARDLAAPGDILVLA
jgi:hypothetical protein